MNLRQRLVATSLIAVVATSSAHAQGGWARTGRLTPAEGYVGTERHFGWTAALSGDTALVAAPPLANGTAAGQALLYEWWGPTWHPLRTLEVPGNTAADDFARALALSGGTALIAAPGEGAVYLFEQARDWSDPVRLAIAPGSGSDLPVVLSGDTGFVGVPGENEVHVLSRVAGDWAVTQVLAPGQTSWNPRFGVALAFDGQRLIVGASREDAVYEFVLQGSAWTQRARLTPPGACDHFGAAVALGGSFLVVGAPDDHMDGRAFVFERSGEDWISRGRLTPSSLDSAHDYGASVSIMGDVIAVGAPGSYGELGSMHLFERGDSGWSASAHFEPDPATGPARFAYQVATDGSHALGNIGLNDAGVISMYVGAIYVYSDRPVLTHTGLGPGSESTAVLRTFEVDAGPRNAGQPVVLLASSAGTDPTPWHGLELPLAMDPLLTYTLRGIQPDLRGQLDASGRASFTVAVPPALADRTLYLSAAVLCPRTGIPEVVSDAVTVDPNQP
jgi:hypothetical protein